MRRVITLLLATSSASGFVSSPLRLLHRQVVASDSTKLFSSPFFSIELVDADHTTSDGCKCIRIADDTTTTILENMDPNAWAINPSKNASGGIFLSYLPSNQHTSNVDVNMGELSLSNSHKGDHIKWLACARQTRYWMVSNSLYCLRFRFAHIYSKYTLRFVGTCVWYDNNQLESLKMPTSRYTVPLDRTETRANYNVYVDITTS